MVKPYRLPGDARPVRYDIHLVARVAEPTFTGVVGIALRIDRPTRRLELHARGLAIEGATLGGEALSWSADAEREMIAFGLPREIQAGEATLAIQYRGRVLAGMEGLYLSKDGAEEMLASQCQETKARAIFPCFDEPEYKASIAWTVTTSPDATVLTNGALDRVETADDGRAKRWSFKATPPLSSYLAAVAIGRLASTPERRAGGVPFRVWALAGKERMGELANAFAARLLPWYEEYFGQPYPYGKYDQLAVPSFSAGAMENAGLVVFRQAYLLRDEATTPFTGEVHIARVVAHEFAHMWFGDLVTFAWWDDAWLNESFAEWIAHKATDDLAPEYRVWLAQQQERLTALSSDALESTHAIYSPVETAEEAVELFDAITYYKGAAVMRMLESFLGADAFRAGLRSYMQEFREKNARGPDLWRHLERASGRPVARIMESWILHPGYPVLHVARAGPTALRLRQERYLSAPTASASSEAWVVPVVVRFIDDDGSHEHRVLLDEREVVVDLPARGSLRFAHANAQSIGFYRQDPEPALLDALARNAAALSPAEQMGLVDDQWAFFQKRAEGADAFLRSLGAVLLATDEPRVLQSALARLQSVRDRLEDGGDAEALDRFREWTRGLVGPKLAALPPPRSHADAFRRAVLLHIAAGVGHDAAAIEEARSLADRELRSPTKVDPNLAEPAVRIAGQFGDGARLDKHLAEYESRRLSHAPPAQVERYLDSLAEFRDPALVQRVLDYTTSGKMPLESVGPLLRSMMRKRHANVATWAHVRSNWPFVRERLGDSWTTSLVERTGDLPPEMKPEVVTFLDASLHGFATQSYGRAVETLDQRAWFEPRARREFVDWYKAHVPGRTK